MFEGYQISRTLHVPHGSREAYATHPYWKKFNIITDDLYEPCATPTISIENGEITFACATEGAECHYSVATSATDGTGTHLALPVITITVSATAEGYLPSDTATLTIDPTAGDLNTDGTISVADVTVLVKKLLGK